jgi:hypothetical protein
MSRSSFRLHGSPFSIDVLQRPTGECFDIETSATVGLAVTDIQTKRRHLLLRAESSAGQVAFLCGHDEMHWFVAALPQSDVLTVADAIEVLKPKLVRRKEHPKSGKHRPKGDVYVRQGEWFFIPCPHAGIEPDAILHEAPLIRGPGSKPHICEQMYLDGEREFICDRYPRLVFFEAEYREMLATRRKAKRWNWRQLPFEPDVYVRGWVTHPDHKPMHLDIWHRVEMNTEDQLAVGSLRQRVARVNYRD